MCGTLARIGGARGHDAGVTARGQTARVWARAYVRVRARARACACTCARARACACACVGEDAARHARKTRVSRAGGLALHSPSLRYLLFSAPLSRALRPESVRPRPFPAPDTLRPTPRAPPASPAHAQGQPCDLRACLVGPSLFVGSRAAPAPASLSRAPTACARLASPPSHHPSGAGPPPILAH